MTEQCRASLDVTTDAMGNPHAAPYPGVTDIDAYGSFGGEAGLNIQVGKYIRFRSLFGMTFDAPHFITNASAGVDTQPRRPRRLDRSQRGEPDLPRVDRHSRASLPSRGQQGLAPVRPGLADVLSASVVARLPVPVPVARLPSPVSGSRLARLRRRLPSPVSVSRLPDSAPVTRVSNAAFRPSASGRAWAFSGAWSAVEVVADHAPEKASCGPRRWAGGSARSARKMSRGFSQRDQDLARDQVGAQDLEIRSGN